MRTVRESLEGGAPGFRLWRCCQCGDLGRLRAPWRVLYYARRLLDRVESGASAIVCSDTCHRRARRAIAAQLPVGIGTREERALRAFATLDRPYVRIHRDPAQLVRVGLLRHCGGREYAWTPSGVEVARTLLGEPRSWTPQHAVFEHYLPGGRG